MFVLLLPSVTSYCYFRGMSHTLAHATTWLVMAHTVAIWLKSIRHSAYPANCQLWQQKFSTADRSVAMVVVASGWWWPAILFICVIVFIIAVKYIDMKVKAAKEKTHQGIAIAPVAPSPRRSLWAPSHSHEVTRTHVPRSLGSARTSPPLTAPLTLTVSHVIRKFRVSVCATK